MKDTSANIAVSIIGNRKSFCDTGCGFLASVEIINYGTGQRERLCMKDLEDLVNKLTLILEELRNA